MGISKLDSVSYKIFGRNVSSKAWEYHKLQHKLLQARIGVPFDVYISRAYFLSILSSLPAGLMVYMLIRDTFKPLLGNFSFLMIPLLSFLFGFIIYNLFLIYPSISANLRRRKIDIVLPHAVALMHSLSRGSSDIVTFFDIIANNKKIYGEVSKEVKSVQIDSKILNIELKTALKNLSTSTPSESFKNFLESLSTIITAGGDLVAFFLTKSDQFRQKALNESKAFMETISLFSEIYVTGFVAGPLFIIVLLVVLGLVGGTQYALILIIVYLLIPGGSLIFVVILSSLTEGTAGSEFIRLEDNSRYEKNFILQRARMRFEVYEFLKHPLKNLIEVPEKVLLFSIPAGLIFFILGTHNYYGMEFNQLVYKIDDFVIFTALIVLIPYSLFVEAHFRRIKQISSNFPEFLNRLVSLHDSGLTIAASIKRLSSSNLGILTSEVNKINTDFELNGSIADAFRNFGRRINTLAVQRVVVLIENAIKMTGNIKDTLVVAANDAMAAKAIEEDRIRSTRINIVIIYIAFFVFLYVVWSLITGFLPQMPEIPPEATAGQIAGEGVALSGIDKSLYIRLFFHASVLEGFFSGLVAGEIGEGDVRLGLKHGLIMVTAAYILFMFIRIRL